MTLREAIQQARNLGHDDPLGIAEFVLAGHGEEIVLTELDAKSYIADIATALIGEQRRRSIRDLARADRAPKREVMLHPYWMPGIGFVQIGDFTLGDWQKVIERYRKGAATLVGYAEWAEACLAMQAEQAAERFKQVKGALPRLQLPEAI